MPAVRDLQLCLLAAGGAEVVDVDTDVTLWASDTDEGFGEEFPELLDENDVEHLLDYLEEKCGFTERELEVIDIITEPLGENEDDDEGPDDLDFDDDEDPQDWDRDEDDDIIDGEVIE